MENGFSCGLIRFVLLFLVFILGIELMLNRLEKGTSAATPCTSDRVVPCSCLILDFLLYYDQFGKSFLSALSLTIFLF